MDSNATVAMGSEGVRQCADLKALLEKFTALREHNQQKVLRLLSGDTVELSEGMSSLVTEILDLYLQAAQNGGCVEIIAGLVETIKDPWQPF